MKITGGKVGVDGTAGVTTVVSTPKNRLLKFEHPIPRGPFVWTGTFPYIADTSADLVRYLGVDGSISTDIGDDSHLWQAEASTTIDVGSLASSTTYDYISGSSAPSPTTDSSYGKGVRTILENTTENDYVTMDTSSRIPEPMDETKSFLFGGIMQWDSFPGADALYNVHTRYQDTGPTKGWLCYVNRAGANERKLIFQFTRGPGFTTLVLTTPDAIPFGEPFAFLCNVDFAAGKMKVMTSTSGSYTEGSVPGSGDYTNGANPAQIGFVSGVPGLSKGFVGLWAQMFTLEYTGSLDAGISEENMIQFLKHCDGYL